MSKNTKAYLTDDKGELPLWEEYSANGGTVHEFLNEKMRRAGLFEFVTSETEDTEQPSLTEKRTLRFVPHSNPQSRSSEHPDDGSAKVSGKQLSKVPNELPSWSDFAKNGGTLGEYWSLEKKIEDSLRKAVDRDPGDSLAWSTLGWHYARAQYDQQALEAFHTAIEIDPGNSDALTKLVSHYCSSDREHQAIEVLKKVVNVNPRNNTAWYGLGWCYARLSQHEQASEAFQKAVVLESRDSDGWFRLGESFVALLNYQQAAEAFEKVVALHPDHTQAWMRLGSSYGRFGNSERSIAAYRKALSLTDKPGDRRFIETILESFGTP